MVWRGVLRAAVMGGLAVAAWPSLAAPDRTPQDRVAALIAAERFDLALPLLKELDAKDQLSPADTDLLLGRIYLGLGKPGKAVEFFEQAEFLSLAAESDALLGQAEARLALGDLNRARQAAEGALKSDSDLIAAHLVLARVDQRLGQVAAAQARLDRLRADRPESPEVALAVARFRAWNAGPQAGLAELNAFAAQHPRAAVIVDQIGLYQWSLDRKAEAIRSRKRARSLYAGAGQTGRAQAVQDWLDAVGPTKDSTIEPSPPSVPAEAASLPPPPRPQAEPKAKPIRKVIHAAILAQPEPLPFPPGSPVMTGSGVVLEGGRRIVTNRHVVDGMTEIAVRNGAGYVRMATVVKLGDQDDLALLEIGQPFPEAPALPLSAVADAAPGRAAVVMGYPLIGILGDEQPALTEGVVAKATGLANDPNTFQITAKLNKGNSGGPVFDRRGRLIGIAVGKMDVADIVAKGGPMPEDINFAIKAGRLRSFLGLSAVPANPDDDELGLEDLYQRMLPRAVLVAARK